MQVTQMCTHNLALYRFYYFYWSVFVGQIVVARVTISTNLNTLRNTLFLLRYLMLKKKKNEACARSRCLNGGGSGGMSDKRWRDKRKIGSQTRRTNVFAPSSLIRRGLLTFFYIIIYALYTAIKRTSDISRVPIYLEATFIVRSFLDLPSFTYWLTLFFPRFFEGKIKIAQM